MIVACRVLVVFASAFLVIAVALAMLTPRGLTLDQGIALTSPGASSWARTRLGTLVQESLLDRPVWFLPAGLGLICAGLAMTLNLNRPSESHQRRS